MNEKKKRVVRKKKERNCSIKTIRGKEKINRKRNN